MGMKVVTGDVLNHMPVGTVFAKMDLSCHYPEPECLQQIIQTYDDVEGKTFISRTDDGVLITKEVYHISCDQGFHLESNQILERWNNPLAICWGTSSVGCWDKEDTYLVLDRADIEKLCDKLLNPIVVKDEKNPGRTYLGNISDES